MLGETKESFIEQVMNNKTKQTQELENQRKKEWAHQQNTHVRTRLDKEHKKHWSINTRYTDTPGTDHRTNQVEN